MKGNRFSILTWRTKHMTTYNARTRAAAKWLKAIVFPLVFVAAALGQQCSSTFGQDLGAPPAYPAVRVYSNCNPPSSPSNNYLPNGLYTGMKWQCVEYVRRFYDLTYGIDLSIFRGDAKLWYDNYTALRLARFPNGGPMPPQVGDVLASNANHIAVLTSPASGLQFDGRTYSVSVAQQNYMLNSTDTNYAIKLSSSSAGYTFSTGFNNSNSAKPIQGWLRKCDGGVASGTGLPSGYSHPAGTFVVSPATHGTVYVLRMQGSVLYRYGIASLAVLQKPYNQQWVGEQFDLKDIVTITDTEMNQYAVGTTVSATASLPGNGRFSPDGRLIKKPGGTLVGIVSSGSLRFFPSAATFSSLGYRFCNVYDDPTFDSYPVGPVVDGTGASVPSTPAVMTSPVNGSTLSGTAVTFRWNAGQGIQQYYLYVGTSFGANNVYAQSQGTNLTATVNGLPTDGRSVYVRLWSFSGSTWLYQDYIYQATSIATVPVAASIVSPSNGATLLSSSVTFQWKSGTAIQEYFLYVGNAVGANDIYGLSQGANLSVTVNGLPADSRTLYVRLWSRSGSTWYYLDYMYRAA